LLGVEIAHRRRHAGLFRLGNILRMHQPRVDLLVVTPLDVATLGRGRIAGVAHIGRVALIAEQRVANLLAGAGELIERAEEHQRMLERHQRQALAQWRAQQWPPDAGAEHDAVGLDVALARFHATYTPVLPVDRQRRRVWIDLQRATGHGLLHQHAGHALRARHDEPRVWIPPGALDGLLIEQPAQLLGPLWADQLDPGAEGLARADLALELFHALVVIAARHLQAADAAVMTELFVEFAAIYRGVARHLVVRGHVAEVRSVRSGSDIRR